MRLQGLSPELTVHDKCGTRKTKGKTHLRDSQIRFTLNISPCDSEIA
jgi:hypothetical protein